MMVLLVLILIVVVLGLFLMGTYNKLVRLRNGAEEAFKSINVYLKQRYDLIPNLSWTFIWSVIVHYQLPFWSIVLITIGGQAIGMRSMSIYELNADYVKFSRFMGLKDNKIVRYVFRNAMLPQITGLALALGTMVFGAVVAEVVFSYPGLGSTILTAALGQDYPLLSATTLIVSIMVLVANFAIEIVYGFLDPRIKAAQAE